MLLLGGRGGGKGRRKKRDEMLGSRNVTCGSVFRVIGVRRGNNENIDCGNLEKLKCQKPPVRTPIPLCDSDGACG